MLDPRKVLELVVVVVAAAVKVGIHRGTGFGRVMHG